MFDNQIEILIIHIAFPCYIKKYSKMAEIVLIQPSYGSWENMGARLPHAMLSIASMPVKKGYDVVLIDQRVDQDWKQKLIDHCKKGPVCVAVSTTTGMMINNCFELVKIIKEHTDAPVIWGGPHPTLFPEQTIKHPLVDMVMVGEGEFTFMKLIERLEKNLPIDDIPGLLYKKDGQVHKNAEREIIKDFEIIPDLPYNLVDFNKYYGLNFDAEKPSITMITSRGCPYTCGFCAIPILYNRSWKALRPEKVIERLKFMTDKYGIKDFYFQEDNFAFDLKRVKGIAEGIIKEKMDITWGTLGIRADTICRIDNDLLKKMFDSGARQLDVGVESGNQRVLDMIGGSKKVVDMEAANKKVAKYPISMKYTFIAGYPTETHDELQDSVNLAMKMLKDNKHAYAPFFVACPYPGTKLYNTALEKGLKVPDSLEGWAGFDQTIPMYENTPWMTKKHFNTSKMLALTSYFTSKNMAIKYGKKHMRVLLSLYHHFAKFRFKHMINQMFIEGKVAEKMFYS